MTFRCVAVCCQLVVTRFEMLILISPPFRSYSTSLDFDIDEAPGGRGATTKEEMTLTLAGPAIFSLPVIPPPTPRHLVAGETPH